MTIQRFVLAVAYLLTGVILVSGSPVGECPPVDPLDHTDHLPDDKNCSVFYKCDHAAPVLFVCPDELHFNKVLEVCDWPDVAGCTASTDASSTAAPTAAPTAGSTPAEACPAVGTCPQYEDENSIAKHLPHTTNCSQFCKCDHGKPVTMDCPAGLHFNAVLEVCDWPQNAGCSGGSGSTSNPTSSTPSSSSAATTQAPTSAPSSTAKPTTAAPSTTAKPTTASPTTTAQPTTAAPSSSPTAAPSSPATSAPSGNCPAIGVCPQYVDENSIAKHLPHASNCSQFCKCDHGKPVTMDCPAGLHFNAVLEVCDWPQNAGCSGGSGSTSNPTSSTPSSSSAATTQAPTSSPTAKPTTAAPSTTADPTTAAPTTADPSTTAKPTTAAPTTTAQPTTAAPSSSSTAAPSSPATSHPSGDCPAIGVCPQYEDENSIAKHLPHASNCSQFCKCDHGKPVTMDCPAGLHFNAVLEVCDWPQNAGCSGGSGTTSNPNSSTSSSSSAATTPAPTSAPSTTVKPTTAAPSTTVQPTTAAPTTTGQPTTVAPTTTAQPTTAAPSTTARPTTAAPTTTAQPTTAAPTSSSTAAPSSPATSDPSGDCPAVGVCPQYEDENSIAKHLPHASNCNQFCKCDHGKPVTMDCPPGLHFNAVLEVCDWPQNAGCSGSSGTTSNPTSSTPSSSSAATTQAPTSAPSTTVKPTTAAPSTTDEPTTAAPSTTAKPTTAAPSTTAKPTTAQPTTVAPSSSSTAAPSSPATSVPSGDCPAVGVCPQYEDENSIAKHLPHASNCSQFCKCDHGKPVTMDCPAGLHFNAVLEVCDWPQNAGCSGGSGTTSDPTSSTPSSSSAATTSAPSTTVKPTTAAPSTTVQPTTAAPNTTAKPTTSAPTTTVQPTTAAPSTTAKPTTAAPTTTVQPTTSAPSTTAKPTTAAPTTTAQPTTAAPSSLSTAAPSSPATSDPTGDCPAVGVCPQYEDENSIAKHLPHASNCSQFCKCDHGKPVTMDCPAGLHFNAVLEVCDWPQNAGCSGGSGTTSNPTSSTPSSSSAATTQASTSAPSSTHLPHRTNCGLYCRCNHGVPITEKCPDGLHFNAKLEVCDWPSDAGCQ
ncbi:mucin-5AC-like [Schistocerca piceifrons]|uniref:mucin-5AC-like n=1 Tax=Schistocerca piceifrons TaxID=274613 RepID=UPI001F5F66BC|nr:mucin-5AC-like [Schistocerca piceifrons]